MKFTERVPCLVIDTKGLVVNRIVCDASTPDDFSPGLGLTILPHTIEGVIGGSYIDGVYVEPFDTLTLSVLTLLSATASLSASWTEIAGAISYKVQWKSGAEDYDTAREILVTSGISTTIASLVTGTEYTVRVLPVGVFIEGEPSAEQSATPN